jgi:hypothetical protein
MKTVLIIASLTSCHLLWGVACGEVLARPAEEPVSVEKEMPGIVLFNLSNTEAGDSRPAYYGVTNDPHRYPNNQMFEAIAGLPKNNRLWTIYPDAFPEADNTLRSWRDFNVFEWNGTTALPTMRPDSYIRRINDLQNAGTLPRDLTGYSFLLDWEHGATTVREMGLTYWSDSSSPRFRTAWTTYRDQIVEIIRTLQARFPTAFFAVYAGGSPARLVAQNKSRTAPVFKNEDGKKPQKYYLHDVADAVRETIRENYPSAMGPLLEAPDFHTVVCYDAYGPLDWDDKDGFPPSKNETYLVENFQLLRDNSTKPVYGVVGTFTSGNKKLSHDGEANSTYQMYWKDRGSWLKRTCRWLANGEADGAVVWNGLDAMIFRYLKLNVRNYSEINAASRKYLDLDQIGGWNQWTSLDQQSGTLFEELARLHGQPDTRNYQTAQRYYDNISLAQRKSDATIDIFLKTMSRTWKDYLLEDLLTTLRTGFVPLHLESDPELKSDQEMSVVGSTIYVSDRIAGDVHSIEYEWRRNGEPIGTSRKNPVHLVTKADVGAFLSCRISYRPKDGSEPLVMIAKFDEVIRSPMLALVEVIEDGSKARGTVKKRMAMVFGVGSIEEFTLSAGAPMTLKSHDGSFERHVGKRQLWTIENGSQTIMLEVPSDSIRIEGSTMTLDDAALLKTLLAGYQNVVTEISLMPSK